MSATANGSGVWSLTLWGSDQITPSNTTYTISITPANSNATSWIAEYLIKSGSYNLANLTPIVVLPPLFVPTQIGPTGATGATGATGTITANSGATIGGNLFIKGPIPWADITSYGARVLTGSPPGATNCSTNGTNTITTTQFANNFQVGDGVTVLGAGSSTGLSAPTGLQVIPAITWGLTGTQSPLVAATGSTTYEYCVVARTKFGGLSAAGTPVTITNGLSSLGKQTATISTLTRSNDQVTVVTTGSTNIVAGTLVQISPTNSQEFAGWYNVASVTNNTTFVLDTTPVDTRAQGWLPGDTTSSANGGTIVWYQCNFLAWTPVTGAWSYYICQNVSGTWSVIGQTKPTGPTSGYVDAAFEDYGSAYNSNQLFPSYVTAAIATGSGMANPLTANVTAVDPSGLIYTLDTSASQTVASTSMLYDAAPSITKAANVVKASAGPGGVLYIPPTGSNGFPINSYLQLPAGITVLQSGVLVVYETITITENVNWIGDWGNQGTPQFGLSQGAGIYGEGASPVVYVQGTGQNGNLFRSVNFYGANANGSTILVADNAGDSNWEYCEFNTEGGTIGNDTTGMCVVIRSTVQTEDKYFFNKCGFFTGPNQTENASWHPSFWIAPPQFGETGGIELFCSHLEWNRRGWGVGGGGVNSIVGGVWAAGGFAGTLMNIQQSYRQGGITPMIAAMSWSANAGLTVSDIWQDTEGQPMLATLYPAPSELTLGPNVKAHFVTGGAGNPLCSGLRPVGFETDSSFISGYSLPNRDVHMNSAGNTTLVASPFFNATNTGQNGSINTFAQPVQIAGGYSAFFTLAQPNTVAGTVAASGSVPVGTWYYAVSAIGADQGETILSVPSAAITTTSGNQTVNLTWTGPVGAYFYNVWRCASTDHPIAADGVNPGTGPWKRVAFQNVGTSYSDTAASPTPHTKPGATATGATIINVTGVYTPLLKLAGATSGGTVIQAAAVASGTLTLPALTGNILAEVNKIASPTLTANYNAGSAKTIFTPTAATVLRIHWSQSLVVVDGASSTFPSLTLGWTDVGGIARTQPLVATSTTNTTAVTSEGSTTIYTNTSTPVTVTSASYASGTPATMTYALVVTTEVL